MIVIFLLIFSWKGPRGAERCGGKEEEHRARGARCRKERGKGRRAPREGRAVQKGAGKRKKSTARVGRGAERSGEKEKEHRAVQKGAKIMKVVTSLLSSK
ncbi:hypothetical protein Q73_01545 [Bacillus coahuilensis m2-6]|nr:hypothetical protein Q73_01545 [Bacillus coahuilensis m2-6]